MQRSTTLNLLALRCPGALTFYEQQAPADRDGYAAGIAAHAVLQALGEAAEGRATYAHPAAIAEAVVQELCVHGRMFDGVPELPLPLDAVLEGRKLALDWWGRQPWLPGARCELGLAVDREWRATAYGPEAYYGGILDVHRECTDEESGASGVLVRDYKSAWTADEEDCDSLQLRGQALLALANAETEPEFLQLEIANLRTARVHTRRVWLDEAGRAELEWWRSDIDSAIRVAERRPRVFRPGRGCIGCPYLHLCKDGGDWAQLVGLDDAATRLAVVEAWRAELVAQLKLATREQPIRVEGGYVGFRSVLERSVLPKAAAELAIAWFRPADPEVWLQEHARTVGLLDALKLGVGSIDAIGKRLFPARSPEWKDRRAELERATIGAATTTRFGVYAATDVAEEVV